MTIKSRLSAVERKTGGSKPEVFYTQTIYEDRDGNPASSYSGALVVGGELGGRYFQSKAGEVHEAFTQRVDDMIGGRP